MMRKDMFLLLGLLLAVLPACDDGVKKAYWDNGKLKSELRYADGKLNGECCWYYPNGQKSLQANYVDDRKEGRLMRWHDNGQLERDCWYKDDVLDSLCLTYSEKGRLIGEEHYTDGKLHGPYKKWHENGQLFQDGQYADGMMDGSWLIFYPDGQLAAKALYDKGSGKQTGYDEEGCIVYEVSYVDNVKHGKEIRYAPNGTVLQIIEYQYGKEFSEPLSP